MRGITPAVKFILILNVAVFLLDMLLFNYTGRRLLSNLFALPAVWWRSLSVGQLFTYMFVHGGTTHLLMNMLGIFFIGPIVEQTLGSYRFFILYYASGILGGLGWSLIAPEYAYCVGASGALMGVLGAFGALYPNAKLLLWFVIPIKAWVLVAILAIWELHETIWEPVFGGIANAAHLMGGIAGFCYAMSLKHPHLLNKLLHKFPGRGKSRPQQTRSSTSSQPSLSKEEVDQILDKIGKEGMGALSHREREMLKKATRG
jgi:membrane associated rhomboid family serine protease